MKQSSKIIFLDDMLRAHTVRECLNSLRACYAHAYERARNFLGPVVTKILFL